MNGNKIPKIIHYCWFGNNEKPKHILEYIKSWKKYLPDYEIIEWNETNFDINYCKYTAEAYHSKKYAFVSDVARLFALYNFGGFYLDTDVEVIKSFDDLINQKQCVFGFEVENRIATSFMGASKNNNLILEFLNIYLERNFIKENGELDLITNVEILTDILIEKGLIENGSYQQLENEVYVYPLEYFSPYDYVNCVNDKNDLTYCIHYFAVSWLNKNAIIKRKIKIILSKIIGRKGLVFLRKIKNSIFKVHSV